MSLFSSHALLPGLALWALAINAVSAAVFYVDSLFAKEGDWRVSERGLLFLAVIGGWPGAKWAQHRFRHKTQTEPFCTLLNLSILPVLLLVAMPIAAGQLAPGLTLSLARDLTGQSPVTAKLPAPPPKAEIMAALSTAAPDEIPGVAGDPAASAGEDPAASPQPAPTHQPLPQITSAAPAQSADTSALPTRLGTGTGAAAGKGRHKRPFASSGMSGAGMASTAPVANGLMATAMTGTDGSTGAWHSR